MSLFKIARTNKTGLAPGTLVYTGAADQESTQITMIQYHNGTILEKENIKVEEIDISTTNHKTLILVEGLSDLKKIEEIGQLFDIHQLVLEDIVNTYQRTKIEDHNDYLFSVLRAVSTSNTSEFELSYEQISVILFRNTVMVFREQKTPFFEQLLKRIRSTRSRFHQMKIDYLAYAILDFIIDQNFTAIDQLDLEIEDIENVILKNQADQSTLNRMLSLKKEIVIMRRHLSPLREVFSHLLNADSPLIHDETGIYFKDASDHILRIIESLESHREILSSLVDMYMSSMSNKMNEVMKVLTIFTTIFTPLTFLAGIYGMNFEYMPELKWRYSYACLWISFIIIIIALLVFFKRKKWI